MFWGRACASSGLLYATQWARPSKPRSLFIVSVFHACHCRGISSSAPIDRSCTTLFRYMSYLSFEYVFIEVALQCTDVGVDRLGVLDLGRDGSQAGHPRSDHHLSTRAFRAQNLYFLISGFLKHNLLKKKERLRKGSSMCVG